MIERIEDLLRLLGDAPEMFRKWDLPIFRSPDLLNVLGGTAREEIGNLARHALATGLRNMGDAAALLVGILAAVMGKSAVRGAVDRKVASRSGTHRPLLRSLGLASSGIAALLGAGRLAAIVSDTEEKAPPLPKRALGSMRFNASILGMGGACLPRGSADETVALLNAALEAGINYFDTASQYGNGESERRIGLWLEALEAEGRRGEVFVATKTLSRGYRQAAEEIDNSLTRLRTEYVDLLQVHAINDLDTWGTVKARNGSLRAIEAVHREGRVKHIGITGHKNPEVVLQALDEYPFESVLCPLGITDRFQNPFVERLLPVLVERHLSVVAMKVYAEGKLPEAEADLEKCLHYTLSLPVSTAIVGMSRLSELVQNVAWVHTYLGMTEEEIEALGEQILGLIDLKSLWWKQ